MSSIDEPRVRPGSFFSRLRLQCLSLALGLLPFVAAPLSAAPQTVVTGVYLLNVNDIDMRTSIYTADFYLWFRWKGPIDPTKSFEFTNVVEKWGMTKDMIYETPLALPGGESYQVFHVQGKFNNKFELWSYPLDTQQISIELEETRNETEAIEYVADSRDSGYNPRLKLPGWVITGELREATTSAYRSHFGDLRRPGTEEKYSRLKYALQIERSRRAYLMRLLLPIAVILLSTFVGFFLSIEYVDARTGIVITSLLSTVALHLAEGSDLPAVGYLVLMDKVYNLSYLVILLSLIETVAAIRWKDAGHAEKARRWDRAFSLLMPALFLVGLAALIVWR